MLPSQRVGPVTVGGGGQDIMYTPWAPAHLPAAFPSPKDGGSVVRMVSNCTLEPSGFQVGRAKCAGLLPLLASTPPHLGSLGVLRAGLLPTQGPA